MTIEAVICDIEGTTTSICFVKDILFPYAFNKCRKYLEDTYDDPDTQSIIDELFEQSTLDNTKVPRSVEKDENIECLTSYVQSLITKDKKVTPLKRLQGKIWKQAFESGEIKGHVYGDVARNFQKWTENGAKVFIYSSGSVEAQKLLFGHSQDGDLTTFLSGYFDTNMGHKQEKKSYENILDEIKVEASKVLFLSDIYGEVQAASEAGINCNILVRPGNFPLSEIDKEKFKIVENFDQVQLY